PAVEREAAADVDVHRGRRGHVLENVDLAPSVDEVVALVALEELALARGGAAQRVVQLPALEALDIEQGVVALPAREHGAGLQVGVDRVDGVAAIADEIEPAAAVDEVVAGAAAEVLDQAAAEAAAAAAAVDRVV